MNQEPQNSLWDSFWATHATSENTFHYLLWRIRFLFSRAYAGKIFKYMGKNSEANILEVGCGSARTLHYLDNFLGGSQCFALDLSSIAIQVVQKISPKFHAGVASAFDLPLIANKFDASFSIGLIEHFTRKQAAQMVNEKIRVTRPGGIVGIVVPWKSSVYNLIVRKAFGRHWPFGEENPFRRKELAQFMEILELQNVKIHIIYGSALLGIGRKNPGA
jgi:ubiquinone/menaquinone biosynthesis C-methylase UbiE